VKEQNQIQAESQVAATAAASVSWAQTRAVLRVVLVVLCVAAALWMLYALESVILLVVLSIFFAYLIAPLVDVMERPIRLGSREIKLPRAVAIGAVYLILFGALGTFLYIVLPGLGTQISQFAQQAPRYISSAQTRAQGLNTIYDRLQLPDTARKAINNFVTQLIARATEYTGGEGLTLVAGYVTSLITYLPWLILIPILAFFFLKDVESFRRSALQMLPRGRWRWRADEFFQDVNSTLAAYIRAQLSACAIVGVICTLGFLLLGLPYWLAMGFLAGFLEFIPLAGPLVVAIIAIVLAGFHSLSSALMVLLFLAVLRIVEDYVIYPRLIGQGIHLHPLAVILAILSGAELAGVAGIFLAIPVIAIATVSYRHWLEHRGSEGIVADMLKPSEDLAEVGPVCEPNPPNPITEPRVTHPVKNTTPDEMARIRPDLTTGELKRLDSN
jgi:predicted PurR-regulated permease PerM